MDILGENHLPVLPPEILNGIFLYLSSGELLKKISLVCRAWYKIINETQFWSQRLNCLGFPLTRETRRDFIKFADDEEVLRSLQATCYHIEESQKQNAQLMFGNSAKISNFVGHGYARCEALACQGRRMCAQEPCVAEMCRGRGGCLPPPSSMQHHGHHHMHRYRQKRYPRPIMHANMLKDIARDMEDDGHWRISEDKVRIAAIMLCFRKPQLIELELYSNYSNLNQVWLLVSQLVNVQTEVHIKDFASWRRPMRSSTDELIHRLTQSQSRCQITLFRGSVQNLDKLPSSIMNLSLSFGSDHQVLGSAKGLAELTQRFPYLDEMRVHIVPGLNVQNLPPLPSGRCQSSLFLSGIGSRHLRWAVNAANKMRPRGIDSQYRYLVFPSSQLIRQTSMKLLRFLEETNQIQFWELVIASPFLERNAETKLVTATRRYWPNCRGFTWIKLDEFLALSHYRW